MARHIEDYAVIGDLRTAALVGVDGAIDWLSLPRFDSVRIVDGLVGRVVPLEAWRLELSTDHGIVRSWTWDEFRALDAERVTVDLHCVTRWSKLATTWTGVPVEALLADVDVESEFVIASSYGGYTTNLPLEDLLDGKAWVVFEYDGRPLDPEHGGPARLLVPHLYLWKSAKWLRGLRLQARDAPGFWEQLGYHNHGDPWREQRHWGD